MNFKKIISGVLAGAMAVSAMAVSAFAEDAKTNVDLQMVVVGEKPGWSDTRSEKQNISADGTYTFKLENLEIDPTGDPSGLKVIYLKDAYAIEKDKNLEEGYKSPLAEGFSVTNFTLKINGKDVAINDGFIDKMKENPVFDYCVFNSWDASGNSNYITPAEETITSVEIAITVVSGNGGAPVGSNPVGDPGTSTPDKNQPNTGVEGVAVVAALAVVAAGAVMIVKKRK